MLRWRVVCALARPCVWVPAPPTPLAPRLVSARAVHDVAPRNRKESALFAKRAAAVRKFCECRPPHINPALAEIARWPTVTYSTLRTCYRDVLQAALASKMPWATVLLVERRILQDQRFVEPHHALVVVLSAFAHMGLPDQCERVLQDTKGKRWEKMNSVLFNILIHAWCRKGDMQRALDLVSQMQHDSIPLHIHTYGSIIHGFCRAGDMDTATEWLHRFESHGGHANEVLFDSLIAGCANHGGRKRAMEFVQEMKARDLVVSANTYDSVVNVCIKEKDFEGALEVFTQMRNQRVVPLRHTCTGLVNACAQSNNPDIAIAVAQDLVKGDHELSITTYNALIDACASAEPLQRHYVEFGLMIRAEMKRKGVSPDTFTISSLLTLCARAKRIEEALMIFDDAARAGSSQVNEVGVSSFVRAVARAHGVSAGHSAILRVIKNKLPINAVAFNTLIFMCAEERDMAAALSILETMRSPEVNLRPQDVTYAALMEVCTKCGAWERAVEIFNASLRAGFVPSSLTFTSLMRACTKPDHLPTLLSIWDLKCKHHAVHSPDAYSVAVASMARCGALDKAMEVYKEGTRQLGAMPISAYHPLIAACEKASDLTTVLQLFSNLREELGRQDIGGGVGGAGDPQEPHRPQALSAALCGIARVCQRAGRVADAWDALEALATFGQCDDRAFGVAGKLVAQDPAGVVASLQSHPTLRKTMDVHAFNRRVFGRLAWQQGAHEAATVCTEGFAGNARACVGVLGRLPEFGVAPNEVTMGIVAQVLCRCDELGCAPRDELVRMVQALGKCADDVLREDARVPDTTLHDLLRLFLKYDPDRARGVLERRRPGPLDARTFRDLAKLDLRHVPEHALRPLLEVFKSTVMAMPGPTRRAHALLLVQMCHCADVVEAVEWLDVVETHGVRLERGTFRLLMATIGRADPARGLFAHAQRVVLRFADWGVPADNQTMAKALELCVHDGAVEAGLELCERAPVVPLCLSSRIARRFAKSCVDHSPQAAERFLRLVDARLDQHNRSPLVFSLAAPVIAEVVAESVDARLVVGVARKAQAIGVPMPCGCLGAVVPLCVRDGKEEELSWALAQLEVTPVCSHRGACPVKGQIAQCVVDAFGQASQQQHTPTQAQLLHAARNALDQEPQHQGATEQTVIMAH